MYKYVDIKYGKIEKILHIFFFFNYSSIALEKNYLQYDNVTTIWKNILLLVFLYVQQAFDKVWNEGLWHKILKICALSNLHHCKPYLLKSKDQILPLKPVLHHLWSIPQGSILGPFLCLIFSTDIIVVEYIVIATSVDDTTSLTSDVDRVTTLEKLQN